MYLYHNYFKQWSLHETSLLWWFAYSEQLVLYNWIKKQFHSKLLMGWHSRQREQQTWCTVELALKYADFQPSRKVRWIKISSVQYKNSIFQGLPSALQCRAWAVLKRPWEEIKTLPHGWDIEGRRVGDTRLQNWGGTRLGRTSYTDWLEFIPEPGVSRETFDLCFKKLAL